MPRLCGAHGIESNALHHSKGSCCAGAGFKLRLQRRTMQQGSASQRGLALHAILYTHGRRNTALHHSQGSCRVCAGPNGAAARPCITARAHIAFAPNSIISSAAARARLSASVPAVRTPDFRTPKQGPASQRELAACLRWTQERHGKALHHSKASCRVCAESESAVAKPCHCPRHRSQELVSTNFPCAGLDIGHRHCRRRSRQHFRRP